MDDDEICDCGAKVAVSVTVARASGEVLDRTYLCADCVNHSANRRALEYMGLTFGVIEEVE